MNGNFSLRTRSKERKQEQMIYKWERTIFTVYKWEQMIMRYAYFKKLIRNDS